MTMLKLKGALRLYVDDNDLFYTAKTVGKSARYIAEDLECICEYSRINQLTLNLKKT